MTPFPDVLIVGAGPAGAVAATVLARAGARVRILDRATFPRDKLCGDTVNPGTVALLRRLDLAAPLESSGLPVGGMLVTGPGGVSVIGRYPDGLRGRSMLRRELDWALLQGALAAGADFEPGVSVRRALLEMGAARKVSGVVLSGDRIVRAPVVIAADGRHSTLGFTLGLARHPPRPRRWAIGGYFDNVASGSGAPLYGEMHIRRGGYVGLAPVPGGLTNVCLVKSRDASHRDSAALSEPVREPERLLWHELTRDPILRDRFTSARLVAPPVVLGPLAVDVRDSGVDGLLMAGDAAGFIDPMTGDGLRFAVRGGELAAEAALQALEHGWRGLHPAASRARRREFGTKWRFNRLLRTLVASPGAVRFGEMAASVAPPLLRAVVCHAGDCSLGRPGALEESMTQ